MVYTTLMQYRSLAQKLGIEPRRTMQHFIDLSEAVRSEIFKREPLKHKKQDVVSVDQVWET